MKTTTKIEWMRTRYALEQKRIEKTLALVSQYEDKTPDEAQKMFDDMRPVTTFRRNGWLNEEERWAIAFYCQKLPRRTLKRNCSLHTYEIAAKFAVSLATVYRYANYSGV